MLLGTLWKLSVFFANLTSRLEAAKRVNRKRYRDFFAELAPRLETAKALDIELDRQLARRFNVFEYLKTDELGLSAYPCRSCSTLVASTDKARCSSKGS